jgi:hypothetical protein
MSPLQIPMTKDFLPHHIWSSWSLIPHLIQNNLIPYLVLYVPFIMLLNNFPTADDYTGCQPFGASPWRITYLWSLVTDTFGELRTPNSLVLASSLLILGSQLRSMSWRMIIRGTRSTECCLYIFHTLGRPRKSWIEGCVATLLFRGCMSWWVWRHNGFDIGNDFICDVFSGDVVDDLILEIHCFSVFERCWASAILCPDPLTKIKTSLHNHQKRSPLWSRRDFETS